MSQTAVVTGGTRGIGLAVALQLVESGNRTVALARTIPPDLDNRIEGVRCDVTDEKQVSQVFADLGPVGILVNNAGTSSSNPLTRTTMDEWDRCMSINVTGPFLCSRAVLPQMLDQGHGHIVTVASTASIEGSRYTAAYTASKHAVLGLMRVIAAEVEGTGVVVGSVCPTFVRTEMTETTIANIADRTGCDLATAETKLLEATPGGRILEVGEVAAAVVELTVTEDNGRELVLDGRNP